VPRTSTLNGGELGWLMRLNYRGSVGFGV